MQALGDARPQPRSRPGSVGTSPPGSPPTDVGIVPKWGNLANGSSGLRSVSFWKGEGWRDGCRGRLKVLWVTACASLKAVRAYEEKRGLPVSAGDGLAYLRP